MYRRRVRWTSATPGGTTSKSSTTVTSSSPRPLRCCAACGSTGSPRRRPPARSCATRDSPTDQDVLADHPPLRGRGDPLVGELALEDAEDDNEAVGREDVRT